MTQPPDEKQTDKNKYKLKLPLKADGDYMIADAEGQRVAGALGQGLDRRQHRDFLLHAANCHDGLVEVVRRLAGFDKSDWAAQSGALRALVVSAQAALAKAQEPTP